MHAKFQLISMQNAKVLNQDRYRRTADVGSVSMPITAISEYANHSNCQCMLRFVYTRKNYELLKTGLNSVA